MVLQLYILIYLDIRNSSSVKILKYVNDVTGCLSRPFLELARGRNFYPIRRQLAPSDGKELHTTISSVTKCVLLFGELLTHFS